MPAVKNNGKAVQQNICKQIKKAGVVGAGGAGFPTHVKLSSKAEIVIANGAECEPLLESDRHLMLREPQKVISGLKAAAAAVGASKGVLAIKRKHHDIIDVITAVIGRESGDEHVLVYEVTGRVVPMGGIPIHAGVVVDNVYTLVMIAEALEGKSFTHRFVTITGEVNRPCVARLPVGISIAGAIEKAGLGPSITEYDVIVGGPMMGRLENDTGKPVTKTTSGIIVIPKDSKLSGFKSLGFPAAARRARSVCCQCTFCTEMCPRFLLGHELKPHQIIRTLPSVESNMSLDSVYSSALCSECGLCGFYACTMGLAPNSVNAFYKGVMSRNGIKPDFKNLKASGPNPFREDRKVPAARLITRLGLDKYDRHLPFIEEAVTAQRLEIPLRQHIGEPSVPVVRPGDRVNAGELLASIPENSLGACIHSPCGGTVVETGESIVISCDD